MEALCLPLRGLGAAGSPAWGAGGRAAGQAATLVGGIDAAGDDFEYYTMRYKVDTCSLRVPHDWAACPFAHKQGGERSARRDLRKYPYLSIPCDFAKQKRPCPKGDFCPHSHSLYEYWLHPDRFRTEVCQYGLSCKRPVCFFAHSPEQLRTPDPSLPPAELCWQTGACLRFGRNKGQAAAGGGGGGREQHAWGAGDRRGGGGGAQRGCEAGAARGTASAYFPPPGLAAASMAAALTAPYYSDAVSGLGGHAGAQLPHGGYGAGAGASLADFAALAAQLPPALAASLPALLAAAAAAPAPALADASLVALLAAHLAPPAAAGPPQAGALAWGADGGSAGCWPGGPPAGPGSASPASSVATGAAPASPGGPSSPASSAGASAGACSAGSPPLRSTGGPRMAGAAAVTAGAVGPQVVFLVVPQSNLDSTLTAVTATGLPVTQIMLPAGADAAGAAAAAAAAAGGVFVCGHDAGGVGGGAS